MGRLGVWELLIIFAVLLLLFGGAKLPQLGASLGSAIKNFKKGFGEDAPDEKGKPAEKSPPALAQTGSLQGKEAEKAGSKSG